MYTPTIIIHSLNPPVWFARECLTVCPLSLKRISHATKTSFVSDQSPHEASPQQAVPPCPPFLPWPRMNTVGWICALYFELAAAQTMLDELHDGVQERDAAKKNSYQLGRVPDHNAAITCLPAGKYGTNDAASVAKDMLRTFMFIRIVLLVGIVGGIPSSAHDIRLGDIVVSEPSRTSGGVIQYDIGKMRQGSKLHRTGHLNSQPTALLTALSRMKADHDVRGTEIPNILRDIIKSHPKMAENGYTFPRPPNDLLYYATCDHSHFAPNLQ
jgi:hypothetical protein